VKNKIPKNILVIRFSAMGDVVLTVPVIQNLLKKYPETHITVLTKPFFKPFFQEIKNVNVYPVDLAETHKGLIGLYRLVKELNKNQKYDCVIDLHSVIRSWIICGFFLLRGVPFFRIDKGRSEKNMFIKGKITYALSHTTERYLAVFKKSGFNFSLEKSLLTVGTLADKSDFLNSLTSEVRIGIAPFAAHKSKEWGLENIHSLITKINNNYQVKFYLFGGGSEEVAKLETLANNYSNVTNIAGQFSLTEEMNFLQKLTAFIGMDSGNMHIAALLGLPVISIWGGTHPDLGFSALYQSKKNHIRALVNGKPCRPFSVYGKLDVVEGKPADCIKKVKVAAIVKRLKEIEVL